MKPVRPGNSKITKGNVINATKAKPFGCPIKPNAISAWGHACVMGRPLIRAIQKQRYIGVCNKKRVRLAETDM